MQTKSKSFKVLNLALPIKREIDDHLTKLELEKRQFLALERQEIDIKDRVQKLRREYNELRNSQSNTRTKIDKTLQNTNIINNVDRSYQNTVNSLNQLRNVIEVKRRQVEKYKTLNKKLNDDYDISQNKLEQLWSKVEQKEEQCEKLKKELVQHRDINHKNTTEFQKSHFNLTRSSYKIENSRKKQAVNQSTFWGQQLRQSKALPFQKLSDPLKNSGILHNEGKGDIMTESVPLAKHRVSVIIHENRQKLRISDNYRKFGQGLDQMFSIMKKYKGRDDIDFIARQFVAKERQVQNLEQYVSTLEGNITFQRSKLSKRHQQDEQLKTILQTKSQNLIEKHYETLNENLVNEIKQLQEKQWQKTKWIQKVGQILAPLLADHEIFNRTNAIRMIGDIDNKIQQKKYRNDQKQLSPPKQNQFNTLPNLDLPEGHNKGTNELLNYEKMKDFAEQFIRNKTN